MVWLYCDDCGDTIKKPKLASHFRTCHGQTFTCVDCSRSFDRQSAQGHNSCVTEHEKYALGATKPGGFAASGFFQDKGQSQAAAAATAAEAGGAEEVIGSQFLATRPPWRCSVCNVSCTSRETLMGHATGVKHKRKARAALGLSGQQQKDGAAAADEKPAAAAEAAEAAEASAVAAPAAEEAAPGSGSKRAAEPDSTGEADAAAKPAKKSKKEKKEKNEKKSKKSKEQSAAADEDEQRKQEQPAAEEQQQPDQEPKAKKGSKKQKKDKKKAGSDQDQPQQPEENGAAAPAAAADSGKTAELLKVTKKQLKKKGQVKIAKLLALLHKKCNGSFKLDSEAALRQQLMGLSEVKLEGDKVLPAGEAQ